MKTNPFELHPDIELKSLKKEKNSLTKQEIFEIIDQKMEEISRTKIPAWGFNKYQVLDLMLSLKIEVENYDE